MLPKHIFTALSALLLSLAATTASAASFDCQKARSALERLICADPALSQLDDQLNLAFKNARAASIDKPLLIALQREWLNQVQRCALVDCRAAFRERTALLEQVAAAGSSTAWNGTYLRYYNGKPDAESPSTLRFIGLRDNRVFISGMAFWYGPNATSGQVHTGELEGIAILHGQHLRFKSDDSDFACQADMTLTPSGLVVDSESGCGGMNVTFAGSYRKK